MKAIIQKWGNSQGVRIPKNILEAVSLKENDAVRIEAEKDCIVIFPEINKHRTLEERFAGYTEKMRCEEWQTDKPEGKEAW